MTMKTSGARPRRFVHGLLALALVAGAAQAAEIDEFRLGPGWITLGTQHVRDTAEKDLAFLDADQPLMEIRVCARENTVRLRNATAWMPGDARQKLWLPLVLEKGRCSKPIRVRGAPRRVTHIAFEYEAMSPGWAGAQLVIAGRPAVLRK
jgi:hypothetical protein